MTKIYGGLFLENLVRSDKYYDLQTRLFNHELIQGIQLRVAHPSFTPNITAESLPRIFSVLPDHLKLFIHCGAENVGVDFGNNFDECGVVAKNVADIGVNWNNWNRETLNWALQIAIIANVDVVVHPGYGTDKNDQNARSKIISVLKSINIPIALETVPPIVDRRFPHCEGEVEKWSSDSYWGFGGTPDDMKRLIEETDKICLLDLTHITVAWNQANTLNMPKLANCKNLERMIKDYWGLPHAKICHFSGIPPKDWLVDSHDFLNAEPHPAIRDAIRQMEAVCLEIPFRPNEPEKTIREIEAFRDAYLS